MTYPENLSLVELAEHYARYHDDRCLHELANRDSTVSREQSVEKPDNQMVFDFHKKIVSTEKTANNRSVNDPRKEAYPGRSWFSVKQGVKQCKE